MSEVETSSMPTPIHPITDGVVKLDVKPDNITARHMIRKQIDLITISSGDASGKIVFSIPLSLELDSFAASLAKGYTYYRFTKMDIEALSVSPLGTASGAVQVAHIPDPENLVPDSSSEGILQLVRQLGSRMMRPRDATLISPILNEWRFCKPGNEPRLTSFGGVVGVVRAPPSVGDFAEWAVTIIAEVEFSVPTLWTTGNYISKFSQQPFLKLVPTEPRTIGDMIQPRILAIPTKDFHVPERFLMHLLRPIACTYLYSDEKGRTTSTKTTSTVLECRKVNDQFFEILIDIRIPEKQHGDKQQLILDGTIQDLFDHCQFKRDERPIFVYNKKLAVKETRY